MRRMPQVVGLLGAIGHMCVCADAAATDLSAFAKTARSTVLLLQAYDADGKHIATGTAFLVSQDGKLITTHHLIEDAFTAEVVLENGKTVPIEGILAEGGKNDLAALKISTNNARALPLGATSRKIQLDTRVVLLNAPASPQVMPSEGLISAARGEVFGEDGWFQITSDLSDVSSGAPVLDENGKVIGVANLMTRRNKAFNTISVEPVKRLLTRAEPRAKPHPLPGKTAGNYQLRAVIGDAAAEKIFEDWKTSQTSRLPSRAVIADANYMHYRSALILGRYEEAARRLEALTERFPSDPQPFFDLAIIYQRMNWLVESETVLKKALDANADFAPALESLADLYLYMGRPDETAPLYQRFLKLQPENVKARYNFGLAQARLDQLDAAWETCRDLKKLDSDWAAALANALKLFR
jgi:Tfp pilus assembly protein PilF